MGSGSAAAREEPYSVGKLEAASFSLSAHSLTRLYGVEMVWFLRERREGLLITSANAVVLVEVDPCMCESLAYRPLPRWRREHMPNLLFLRPWQNTVKSLSPILLAVR
jgi:hypothetical protein